MTLDLQEVFDFAIALSKKAGAAIVEGSETRFKNATGFDEKKNTADLVTETDQNTEKLVCEAIKAKYPDHKFIGEESWAAGEQHALTNDPTWIIDPIDGTTNFVKGFPFVCISIGFVYHGEPTIGVIFAPFLGQLFAGRKGHGAFTTSPLHPERRTLPLVQPPPLPTFKQALIAFEWGSDRSLEVMEKKARSFQRLVGDAQSGVPGGEMALGVRSMGSAALNFAHVAMGALDAYWEIGCWAWDAAQAAYPPRVTPDVLTGRKYLVVRAIGDTPSESGREAQKRFVRTFYGAVEEWDP
ncbi:myo inositol monophosphatase [Malassezia pachydermatis]|uniref:Inositol-1-monophosphatase n=1 Tax=Malassezia pachydermatis TaxID=77020 RepID=A0A0M8MT52_9BASI|nr:myo inositol monophosphatase [Malassezia pachydermatis]KOS13260.1 myo inositol monophosphatase [Malassezia pachydermatis]